MKITNYTEYALRTLMYINAQKQQSLVTVEEVATFYGLPMNHLKKVFWKLNELGYINSVRGRNGGYYLDVDPQLILLGNLMGELENLELTSLVKIKVNAHYPNPCFLTMYVDEALSAFIAKMNQYNLNDLLKSNLKISQKHRHEHTY